MKWPCVIIAGGQSRRFGGDKLSAPFGKTTVMGQVISRLVPQSEPVAINCDKALENNNKNLTILADPFAAPIGPLGGILAAMEWAHAQGSERVLTCAGDTPFVPKHWAQALGSGLPADIIVSRSAGRAHYICSLWKTSLAQALVEALRAGNTRVGNFIESQTHHMVDFEIKGGIDPFFNINTRDDLKKAEHLLMDAFN